MKKVILVSILGVIVILVGVNVYFAQKIQPRQTDKAIVPAIASQITTMYSPDGKQSLVLKKIKVGDKNRYSFFVSGKEIFAKDVDLSSTISIPLNTWSPNNTYVFLKEESPLGAKFFVLSVSLTSSDQSDKTANITDLFTQKYPNLKIGDVTGWLGINLIVVNSVKSDGSRGPSFWFTMPDKLLTQLSTLF